MIYLFDDYIKNFRSGGYRNREIWLKKNHPEIYFEVINYNEDIDMVFKQKVFHFFHKMKEIPICLNDDCNNLQNIAENLN